MSLTRHECPSCGASVKFHGVTSIICEFCNSHLSRPRQTRVTVDWKKHGNISGNDHVELENLLAYFSTEDLIPDSPEDHARACRLVELAPSHWCGYYHRAHARFWLSIKSKSSFDDFFANLQAIDTDIEECTRWCDDPAITSELQEVIFTNMAEIAVYQHHHGFTGTRIENIMKMLLVCSAKLPGSSSVQQSMDKFGQALISFARSELERAKRQAGDGFRPPKAHLEYLFYAWKYLHVKDGLEAYDSYAQQFTKNSNDAQYKAVLNDNLEELRAAGLIEQRRAWSLSNFKKKSWFS